MSKILFQFLIVLLCYLFHKTVTHKKISHLLYFQIVIILLFLTKPIFYLFIIPNVALGIWFTKHIKRAYLLPVLPVIICVLYMNWNYQRTGSFEFSSIQNINLKNYNLLYFNIATYGEEYALQIDSKITDLVENKNTYSEKQNEISDYFFIFTNFNNINIFYMSSVFS